MHVLSDTTDFALKRWEEAVTTAVGNLSPNGRSYLPSWDVSRPTDSIQNLDRLTVTESRAWQNLYTAIQKRANDANALPATRRYLNQLQPLPRTLENLTTAFIQSINPQDADFSVLYGLVDLNITVCGCKNATIYACSIFSSRFLLTLISYRYRLLLQKSWEEPQLGWGVCGAKLSCLTDV